MEHAASVTSASDAAVPRGRSGVAASERSVPAARLVAALMLFLGAGQLGLLCFLGLASPGGVALYAAALAAVCAGAAKPIGRVIPWRRLLSCLLVAFAVLLLGGEGHLFYANVDWQVRDAVLADMIRWPWPFAYARSGSPEILRAPIGMYLLPALVGKAAGIAAAHGALLVQNSLMLGSLLALGSLLFETARARRIALGVVLAFSGMDTVAVLLARADMLWPFDVHVEGWAPQLQYSSMLTLAFWVPQHAIAGWLGGLLFLLWRRGIVPLRAFLGSLPLCLLWSPLAVIGTIPFALLAAGQAIAARRLRWADLLIPTLSALLAAPSLLYLGLDAGRVGMRFVPVAPLLYVLFEAVEVVPLFLLAAALGGAKTYGRPVLLLVACCLAAFPFVGIGENDDFVMRASIPALLVLALIVAERIADAPPSSRRAQLILVLALGALTPARELYRAVIYRPTPFPDCDVAAAWQESFAAFGMHTYFARASSLPPALRIVPAATAMPTSRRCYARAWKVPRWSFLPSPVARAGVID